MRQKKLVNYYFDKFVHLDHKITNNNFDFTIRTKDNIIDDICSDIDTYNCRKGNIGVDIFIYMLYPSGQLCRAILFLPYRNDIKPYIIKMRLSNSILRFIPIYTIEELEGYDIV